MDICARKEPWFCKPFAFFLMLELLLFMFNSDKYFQLSGFYIPLIVALGFGVFSFIRYGYEKIQILCLALMVSLLFSMLLGGLAFNRGYLLSYLVGILLLFEFSCMDISKKTLSLITNSYIASAALISLIIIVFQQRYYQLEANRLTIQIGSNPLIDPNYLAAFLAIPFILAFYQLLRKKHRIFSLVTAAIICTGVLLTGSRGGLVAIALGAAFAFFSVIKITKKIFFILLFSGIFLVIAGAAVLPTESIERLFNIGEWLGDPSNLRRFKLWENAIRTISMKPLFGYGPLSTGEIIGNALGDFEPAHNTFFDICLQGGLVFTSMILGVMGYTFFGRRKNKLAKCICLTTAVVSIFIGAEASLYFWLNLGLAVCLVRRDSNE